MFRMLSTSAVALIAAAAPVFAEITPAQVWERMTASQEKFGYKITEGARDEAGDTLTITDVTMRTEFPTDPTAEIAAGPSGFDLMIPKVVLQQTGDGGVKTVYEGDITGKMVLPEGENQPSTMNMTFSMPGNEITTSGTPEAMDHVLNYPSFKAVIDIRDEKGMVLPFTIDLTDTKGSYRTAASGDGEDVTYDMTSAALTLSADVTAPADAETGDGGGNAKVNFNMADLGMTGEMKSPGGNFDMATQMNAALKAGLAMTGAMTFGGYDGGFEFAGKSPEGADQTAKATFTGEGGDLKFAMSGDGLTYGGGSKASNFEIVSSDLPFPISYALAAATFDMGLPISQADEPQPFNLAYSLQGLTLGDAIWSLFDPTAQLPRDPADLTVDVSGQVKVKRDLFDEALAAELAAASTPAEGQAELSDEQLAELERLQAEAMPYEPISFDINRINLKAVGAEADLTGQLSIPEGGDMDAPVGKISGNFKGVNSLIDRLAVLGFVPQDQVMGIKMMLAAFARPVDGDPEAMTTELEFKEDGSVFANGQQVK